MSDKLSTGYFAARAARARELADSATEPYIAAIHRRMVESYSELALYEAGRRPPLRVQG